MTNENLTYIFEKNDRVCFTPRQGYSGVFGAQFTGAYGIVSEGHLLGNDNVFKIAVLPRIFYGLVSMGHDLVMSFARYFSVN